MRARQSSSQLHVIRTFFSCDIASDGFHIFQGVDHILDILDDALVGFDGFDAG
jgi:hypothetical protein